MTSMSCTIPLVQRVADVFQRHSRLADFLQGLAELTSPLTSTYPPMARFQRSGLDVLARLDQTYFLCGSRSPISTESPCASGWR